MLHRFCVLVLPFFVLACASNQKYAQERVQGERGVWLVKALEVPCSDDVKECHDNVKKLITMRGKKVCKKQIFSVEKCDYAPSSNTTIAASCRVHCGQRATGAHKKTIMHAAPQEDTGSDPDDDTKPFDWN